MDKDKEKIIQIIVEVSIDCFVEGLFNKQSYNSNNISEAQMLLSNKHKLKNTIAKNILHFTSKQSNNISNNLFLEKDFDIDVSSLNEDFWALVCGDAEGFKIVEKQYNKSFSKYIHTQKECIY